MSPQKLVRESIAEQIYAIIKEEILLAKRKPGEQLNPRKLAEEFESSVMPVRDALKQLVDEGLVVRKPRVGFFVRSFSRQEIKEIMEVRKLYELYCLESYFERIDREKLIFLLERCMLRDWPAIKDPEFDRLDDDIHDLIVSASENVFLIESYNNIKDRIFLIRHLGGSKARQANEEHILLIQAILNNDKGKAKEILQAHIDRVTCEVLP